MKDNLELVDRDYSRVRPTDRIIGKLRLKRTSFSRVLGYFNKFRISRLEKKLDNANKELEKIVENANIVDEKVEKEILKKTMAIVKLEEKIKILKLENVPSSYVENRAIKLKNDMMEAARKNAKSAYAEEEKVNNDEASDYGFTDFANTDFAMAAMAKKEKDSEEEKDASKSLITPEDIKDVIEEKYSEINGKEEDNKESSIEEEVKSDIDTPVEPIVDRSEIEEVIEEPKEDVDYSVDKVIKEASEPIEEKVVETPVQEEVDERVKVYNTISDEDLSKARENINYDKYENKYAGNIVEEFKENMAKTDFSINKAEDNNVRDEIIVTPERDNMEEKVADYTFVEDTPESVHFDSSEATVGDIKQAVNIDVSPEGFKTLKDSISALKEEQSKSKATLDEARKLQNEESRRAEEARKLTNETLKKYKEAYSKLLDYEAAVKEDIAFNNNAIASANEEAENNRKFIKEQEELRQNYENEMAEMFNIMSPEAINVRMGK